jgi:hypothetical protein
MDIIIGVLSAALLIGVSNLLGRSLDRAKSRAFESGSAKTAPDADADLYGDF